MLDIPGLDAAVLADRDDGVLVEESDAVDLTGVGKLDLDLLAGVLCGPDEDVRVDRARGGVGTRGRPGDACDAGSVEDPVVDGDLPGLGVEHGDLALRVTDGEVLSIGRVGEGADLYPVYRHVFANEDIDTKRNTRTGPRIFSVTCDFSEREVPLSE